MTVDLAQDERAGLPSASGGPQWVPCPPSFRLQKRIKKRKQKSAVGGLKLHAVMDGKRSIDSLGEAQAVTASALMALESELFDKLNLHGATWVRERRIWVQEDGATMDEENKPGSAFTEDSLWSARSDVIFWKDGRLFVFNYKTGITELPSIERDWQMKCEGIAAAAYYEASEVTYGRMQPLSNDPLVWDSLSGEQLVKAREKAATSATLAMMEDAPFKPGLIQCEWCDAKPICEAYKERDLYGGSLGRLSEQDRKDVLEWAWIAKVQVDRILTEASKLLRKDNDSIPGFYLDIKAGIVTVMKEKNYASSQRAGS